jgi:hypothetical protein
MKSLPPQETIAYLNCPNCSSPGLKWEGGGDDGAAVCTGCGRLFPCDRGVVDFVMPEHLDPTNRNEIRGNAHDLENPETIRMMTSKEDWSAVYTHMMMKAVGAVLDFIRHYPADTAVFSLGSGTAYELKILLRSKPFRRVFSSDISKTATLIAPINLSSLEGEVGLFLCTFDQCPVRKQPGTLGMVFQALHHSSDIHRSIENLLKNNFTDLVIVEPTTNWFVEILARFNLAKRVEYSGLKPDWMDLHRVRRIAAENGYDVKVRTWWEYPPPLLPRFVDRSRILKFLLCSTVDLVSWVTNCFRFGGMSAVLFTRPGR